MPIPQIFENVHNFHLFSLHPLESATMTPNYFHFSKCPMHPLIPGFLNMLVSLSLDFFLCHSHSSCGLTKSSLSFMSQLKCSFCLQAFPDPPKTGSGTPFCTHAPCNSPVSVLSLLVYSPSACKLHRAEAGSELPLSKPTEPTTTPPPHQVLSKCSQR